MSGDFISSLPDGVRQQTRDVYTDVLKAVWEAAIAFAVFSFLLVFVARDLELRTELDTDYGFDEGQKVKNDPKEGTKEKTDNDDAQDDKVEHDTSNAAAFKIRQTDP